MNSYGPGYIQYPITNNALSAPIARPNYQIPGMWNNGRVRPVASIEEVKASPIDFDGSIFYFPDIANQKIYTKFVNVDGTVTINLYELKDLTISNNFNSTDTANFVTRTELEEAVFQLRQQYEELLKNKEQSIQYQSNEFQF